jgi:hypothetical protein
VKEALGPGVVEEFARYSTCRPPTNGLMVARAFGRAAAERLFGPESRRWCARYKGSLFVGTAPPPRPF